MPRIFKNWLDAYREYSDDGWLHPPYNTWSGLSVIAGALERKVWLPWDDSFSYYPNIYVLLVSIPADGKSTAMRKAVDLLHEVSNRNGGRINFVSTQLTLAQFVEEMGQGRSFSQVVNGAEVLHFQNAGYYHASEASNSLQNIFGDFIAGLTDFYDCPSNWVKGTKKDGKRSLKNVCVNVLAGATFEYLGKLVNDDNINGGFASRLIYIVCKDKVVTPQPFQKGQRTEAEKKAAADYKNALIADLADIYKMVGPMYADDEFAKRWEVWYPDFEKRRRSLESEKLQSLLARTQTNVLKVAMLLSAAESSSRELKAHHWDKALELVSPLQEETPQIFRAARAMQRDGSPSTVQSAIIDTVLKNPGIPYNKLTAKLLMNMGPRAGTDATINAMLKTGVLRCGEGFERPVHLGENAQYDL